MSYEDLPVVDQYNLAATAGKDNDIGKNRDELLMYLFNNHRDVLVEAWKNIEAQSDELEEEVETA